MFAFLVCVSLILGFLMGGIPTSYIVAKIGKIDLLREGPSHVSGTAVYRHFGLKAFILVVIVDLCKGMPAIYVSQVLTNSVWVAAGTALAAIIGHCWSVYIKFHGGLGAVIIFGSLFYLDISYGLNHIPWGFAAGGLLALVTLFILKKSTFSTFLWMSVITVSYVVEIFVFNNGSAGPALAILPVACILVQIIKMNQPRMKNDKYKNELFSDLKRQKTG
jgi:acyl-phosphate glycerol 3-phosphate acyltransferase